MRNETRFREVEREYPQRFAELAKSAQQFVTDRYTRYQQIAGLAAASNGNGHAKAPATAAEPAGSAQPEVDGARGDAAPAPSKSSSGVMNSAVAAPTAPTRPEQMRPLRINMTAGRGD